MTRTILILLLIASCTPEELPHPWFEREWISDRDSTLAVNEGFQELDPESRETVLANFGKLRWLIDGFTLAAIYPEEPQFNAETKFSIEAIDSTSFLLLTEAGTNFQISGDGRGFCATPGVGETTECFVPFDLE